MCLRKVLLCVFMLICFSGIANSLLCYQCDSLTSTFCDERNFTSSAVPKSECYETTTFTAKYPPKCYKAVSVENGKRRTVRKCFDETTLRKDMKDNCMILSNQSPNSIFEKCESCDKALCNTGTKAYTKFGTILLLFVLGVYLF